ncbi:MAG TPA: helical backbone metal receptor [Sedimentisphaerales bacterium]|nr:helical backbone metal receptor [Sedimentisphaerales bacterium]HRS11076.1 helical backbone metal receptor [Sedimentisphaerales bacterium]HRV47716.1 helical backbone metal receptor [Sedimentisphaerales bacterium]
MRRWVLLLAAMMAWNIAGYALWRAPRVDAVVPPAEAPRPERIVSMAPNLTEILYALGLGENVVAVTSDSDYPPQAAGKPSVGSFWLPDIEAVIAGRPDLIVTLEIPQQTNLVVRLRRMGYRCLGVSIWTVDEFFRAVETIGQATGQPVQAQSLVSGIRQDIRRLTETRAGKDQPRVLWVVQREPLRVAGRNTFINELIELAGGQNAIGPTLHKYPPIGAEQVIGANVEVIVEPAMTGGDLVEQRRQALAYWSHLPRIPAVANGRIYVIDPDAVSRLSPRLCQGIESIAACLWPADSGG